MKTEAARAATQLANPDLDSSRLEEAAVHTSIRQQPKTTFTKGDRVTFTANQGRVTATGTVVDDAYTEPDGTEVAQVKADPNPFVLSSIPHTIDVADLKLIRGAR